jgi:cell division protein FtsQ
VSVRADRRPPRPPARPRVDPRMRDRRVAVTRAQGRRRLRALAVLGALAAMALAGWLVLRSPLLDVDDIVVRGAAHTPAATVEEAAGVSTGEALVFVDLGTAARRVERLPWVATASVERHLPGELSIRVTERVPAAWVRRAPDRVAVLDGDGRVLADAPEPPSDLPELTGTGSIPAPGGVVRPARVAGVVGLLVPELRADVIGVRATGGTVALLRREGPEVRLGAPVRVGEKSRVALAVVRTLAPPFPAYVDVTVPDAPVTG